MQFSGHYLFQTTRLRVWEALNDTDVLGAAIPGCDKIEWVNDRELDVAIKVNLGVMNPVFSGGLELSNIEPAKAYTLTGTGKGRLLGFAKGEANVELSDHPQGTALVLGASGEASSAIMALGQSLVGRTAQGVIDRFFVRIGEAMDVSVSPIHEEH